MKLYDTGERHGASTLDTLSLPAWLGLGVAGIGLTVGLTASLAAARLISILPLWLGKLRCLNVHYRAHGAGVGGWPGHVFAHRPDNQGRSDGGAEV